MKKIIPYLVCLFAAVVFADDFDRDFTTGTAGKVEVRSANEELGTAVGKSEMQAAVQKILDDAVASGAQSACQCCVYINGEMVVDAWAGTMATNSSEKIKGDTLFPIFSTEKAQFATSAHIAHERGLLDYEAKVNKYWPEFKGGNKDDLTVRQVLGMRTGLPGLPAKGTTDAQQCDWKYMTDWAANSETKFPGRSGYLGHTWGWYLGKVVENVFGRPLNDVLTDEVLKPAGIEHDYYFACPESELKRVVTVYNGKENYGFEEMNKDCFRMACVPAAFAVADARAIAKFYVRLSGQDGKPPLIKRETLMNALKVNRAEDDPVPDAYSLRKNWQTVWGLGYTVWGERDNLQRITGSGGLGGSEGFCDLEKGISIGYTCAISATATGKPWDIRPDIYRAVGIRTRYTDPAETTGRSVADFVRRAEAGETLNVVWFGGSLTWGANASDPNRTSLRALVSKRLAETYPNAHFNFKDAAIGGVGSTMEMFRVERDVLSAKPDLVFFDTLVNDGEKGAGDLADAAEEAIVRRLLTDSNAVVVPLLIPWSETIKEKDPASLKRWERQKELCRHYSLACADILGECRRRYAAGKLDMKAIWPDDFPDTLHPYDLGYKLYADIIWDKIFRKPAKLEAQKTLPKWIGAKTCAFTKRMPIASAAVLPRGWKQSIPWLRAGSFDFTCSRWMDTMCVAANCERAGWNEFKANGISPAPLKGRFRGEVITLIGESMPHCGSLKMLVDGKEAYKDYPTDKMGKNFPPSAYLFIWPKSGYDPSVWHTFEIIPLFGKDDKPAELRLESVCVAGSEAAEVEFFEN